MKNSEESYNKICNKGNEIHEIIKWKTGGNYILREKDIFFKNIFKSIKTERRIWCQQNNKKQWQHKAKHTLISQ
jgi:hypothetical protein